LEGEYIGDRVEVDTVDGVGIDWRCYEEHDTIEIHFELGQVSESELLIKIIFPHVYQQEAVVHDDYALFSDQAVYVAGRREYQAQHNRIGSQDGENSVHGGRRKNGSQQPNTSSQLQSTRKMKPLPPASNGLT
jgi:hypothetical protein